MIPVREFEEELKVKLFNAYIGHRNHQRFVGTASESVDRYACEVVTNMGANGILWDLQFPEVRQYLRYILARPDIDWTYVDNRIED